MTGSVQSVRDLVTVLDLAFKSHQSRMAEVTRRIDTYHKQMRDLDRPQAGGEASFSPATRAGADMRWQRWVDERRKRINQELALVMRDREVIREDMKNALQKLEAARRLEEQAVQEAKRAADRRASW